MKWDIDKALESLTDTALPGTSLTQVVHSDSDSLKRMGIKPTSWELTSGSAVLWCLSLGAPAGRKLFVYGRSIRATFLRARKIIKALPKETLGEHVLKDLKKKAKRNSYASARKNRK